MPQLDATVPPADAGSSMTTCPPGFVCFRLDAAAEAAGEGGDGPSLADAWSAGDATTDGASLDGEASLDSEASVASDASSGQSDAQDAADAGPTIADAGSESGCGADATAAPASPTVVLSYRVVDAEQSSALASIVMVSDTPTNTLHIFNEVSQVDQSVTLPEPPIAVAVDPSGRKAAVAYDAHVSWVDLQTATLLATCPLGSNAYDLVLTSAGVAYVVPATDQWVSLHAVDLTSCTETTGSTIWAGSHIALHPSQLAAFTADQGLSPSRINRCNITGSTPSCTDAENTADWGTYSYCGNLWISADGQRIYSACGVTLRVPGNVNGSPASYGGTLSGVTSVVHMSEAPCAQEVALIPGTDTAVRIHETNFLGFVSQANIPSFPLPDGGSAVAHGRFVFTTSAMDMLYVIVQADSASGALNDYAIATFAP
jgi:hypothetical protein